MTCQFEKNVLDVKVVLNASGKVAGLFFVPSEYSKPVTEYKTLSLILNDPYEKAANLQLQLLLQQWKLPAVFW